MRIRTIKPTFWHHEGLAALPAETRLLAIALLNWADDDGYFMAAPALLRGNLFPFHAGPLDIPGMLQELVQAGWMELGKDSNSRQLGRITNFAKHQRINRPSTSPLKAAWQPSGEAGDADPLTESSPTPPGTLTEPSATIHGALTEDSLSPHCGKGIGNGRGKEEERKRKGRGKEEEKEKDTPLPPQGDGGGSFSYQKEFDVFWNSYPRKQGKGAAFQAWKRIKGRPAVGVLCAALSREAASEQWQKDRGRYIPHPATWLSQRRWEDGDGDGDLQVSLASKSSPDTPPAAPLTPEETEALRRQLEDQHREETLAMLDSLRREAVERHEHEHEFEHEHEHEHGRAA